MDKKYVTLFKELAQNAAASAETVMDYDRELKDEQGLKVATTMRDDFQNLADRIAEAGENYVVNKADAAKLMVSSLMIVNQMQDKIALYKKAMAGYQSDVIPKLQEILDEAETDEEAVKLSTEKFILEDNE